MTNEDTGPIPAGFENEVWKEWADLLAEGKHLVAAPESRADFEAAIHPLAEAFMQAYDDAGVRLDHDLPREARQFCHCLSQVITGRLMELQEIGALPIEVYAALAFSAIGGWQAAVAYAKGQLDLREEM